ncbi:uncharacterized protein LOC111293180 [Durio zibethinus]|uniref:Uncharacterized protein LOC111293180 n=1 Tax=Durio zibethinus TaxID=66656 RepID=A0A6P5YN26_DURZI|nr:uncharacterized protein LOC111293180 [Durio zibethinus]
MIERCLVFHMSRDDCVKALAKHAKIEPIITLTVWKELLKENEAFFQAYFQAISARQFSCKGNKTLHADDQFGKTKVILKNSKTNGFCKILYPSYKGNEFPIKFSILLWLKLK